MANSLETEGSFDPISPKVKLRANQLGVPMDHLDVDNNFEVLRLKINEVIDEANKNPAEQNVQSDWLDTNVGSDSFILNKPTLSRVASSGNYEDLVNTPSDVILQNSQSIGLAFATIDLINDRATAVETSLVELANSAGVSLANSVSLSSGLTATLAELRAVDTAIDDRVSTIETSYQEADSLLAASVGGLQVQIDELNNTQVSLGSSIVSLGNRATVLEGETVSLSGSISAINTELGSLRATDTAIQESVTALDESTTTQFTDVAASLTGQASQIAAVESDITTLSTKSSVAFDYEEDARSGITVGEPNTYTLTNTRRDRTIWLTGQVAWIDPLPTIQNDRAYIQFEMPAGVFPEASALGMVSVHAPSSDSLTLGQEPEESDWYVSTGYCKYVLEGGKHLIFVQLPNLNGKFLWKFEFQLSFLLDSSL